MKALLATLQALADAGASADMLVKAAAAHISAHEDALAKRRASDANRQRAKREREATGNVMSRDTETFTVTETEPPRARVVNTTSSLRSEGIPAIAGTAVAVLDARDRLWGEGREILSTIAHKPDAAARALLGKFLKQAGNDAERVLGAIIAARDHRVIDPVPWITQHLAKPNPSARNDLRSPSERRFEQAFDNIEQRLRDIGVA